MEDINLGARVRQFRNMRGLSLRELAARAGTTPSMLSQMENNGVNPSINTLKSLAAALQVPLEALTVGGSGFVYGVTAFDSAEGLLIPPSSAKPLRASTVKR